MYKEIEQTSNDSVTLHYILSDGEDKLDLSVVNKETLEFIGNREVYKLRSFGDDKGLYTAIIFNEEYITDFQFQEQDNSTNPVSDIISKLQNFVRGCFKNAQTNNKVMTSFTEL